MKRIIFVTVFFFIFTSFLSLYAQWARTYGGEDDELANSIQLTRDGGYIVAGYTESFGARQADIWVLKLDSTGDIQWQKTYGGYGDEAANSIQQTRDGGYIVAGYTESFGEGSTDIWVLKLDSTGDIQWQKTYGGYYDETANFIQQTSNGGYIVVSTTDSFTLGTLRSTNIWVLKLDSTGTIEWQNIFVGIRYDEASSIQQTSDGGYIVAASTQSFNAARAFDVWLLKLDSNGAIQWRRAYGGNGDYEDEMACSIQQTSDGGYIILSKAFSDEYDPVWVFKINSTGSIQWQMACEDDALPIEIQQTNDGGYILVGSIYISPGRMDMWVLKLDSTGFIQWQKAYAYGGINIFRLTRGHSIRQTFDGGYIVTGYTESYGAGEGDVLVLRLDSNGDIGPSCGFIADSDALSLDIDYPSRTISFADGYTSIHAWNTSVDPQDSDAITELLCKSEYILTISASTGGTTDPAPGSHNYDDGTVAAVEALPDTGFRFLEWTGDVSEYDETDNPVSITMDSDKSITANFLAQYKLTIAAGTGGTTNPSPGTYSYDDGTMAVVEALPETGYRFLEWTGDIPVGYETDNPINISTDSDKSISANFIAQYLLTVAAGTGGTTNPIPGAHSFDDGVVIVLEALPETGYRFLKWTGDVSEYDETDNPVSITMDSDKSIVANFIAQYKLTIAAETGGTTDSVPGNYIYDSGTQVSIKAIPNSGYKFRGWSGDAAGTTNPVTIAMDSDKSVTANFTKISDEDDDGFRLPCFIATTAYGSPLHPYVETLRDFRDKYLLPNKIGREFIDLYYKYSPFIANIIAKHKPLRLIVQINLTPFVVFSYSMVRLGPIITGGILLFILVLPVFFIYVSRKR